MNKTVKTILIILSYICIPAVTYANMVWPALYAETKISSIPIILLSLLIEFFFFKWLFKIDVNNAFFYTLAANAASGLAGLLLRPLSGIVWELSLGMLVMKLFAWGTFNPVAWFFVPVIGGAVNAYLELLAIRILWKHEINVKNYFLTWGINIITVAAATVWVILKPPIM